MSRATVGSPAWIAKYKLTDEQRDLVAKNTGLAYSAVVRDLRWVVALIGLEETNSLALDALCHAARLYPVDGINPHNGEPVAFSTYATDCIKKIVVRDFRRLHALIRVPDHFYRKVQPGQKPLPHAEEAAKVRMVYRLGAIGRRWRNECLDPPMREEPERCDFSDDLNEYLRRLDPRSQTVLARHFQNDPLTLDEIGKELGVTRERVRQIEAEAIDKLRECFGVELRSPKVVRKNRRLNSPALIKEIKHATRR